MLKLILTSAAVLALIPAIACKVASPPGKLETRVASAVKLRITVRGSKDVNPLAATPDNVHQGQAAFSQYCVSCHGLDGQNTGVPFADRMYPPVPLLSSPDVQQFTDGQLKWIIDNGIGPSGMPASRGILRDEEIWSIVLYIRHLPPKGSLGEPAFYGGGPPQRTAAN
jgi:S-disulfanyl-L-cysteine oxidoreductase SoxD